MPRIPGVPDSLILPAVLAGPMVRRATTREINLWVATSRPIRMLDPDGSLNFDLDPEVELRVVGETDVLPITEVKTRIFTLGKNLFVTLLTLTGDFPSGKLISYDILENAPRDPVQLQSLFEDILDEITLPQLDLPTFVLQGKNDPLRAIYGSCRKLHGPGTDQMGAALSAIQAGGKMATKRPHVLFLGGDQIYADDVSSKLIKRIGVLGKALVGQTEFIPGMDGIHTYKLPNDKRGGFLTASGFTSGYAENHLMTFGEYAATYLLAWNPHPMLWPSSGLLGPDERRAREGSKDARRVLANVVSYMIFDDHEVTDDWFISKSWRDGVFKHRRTRRVITNGLAAYWAFQGLGNNPDAFLGSHGLPGFVHPVLSYLENPFDPAAGQEYDTKVWSFVAWSYLAPTHPPALVLNTRTRRTFGPVKTRIQKVLEAVFPNTKSVPTRAHVESRLFSPKEKERLIEKLSGVPKNQPLIVVAPTPVFGFGVIEWVLDTDLIKDNAALSEKFDRESFSVNPTSMIDLMDVVQRVRPSPLIILSGDVHYAFEKVVRVVHKNGTVIPVVQLCSSSMKNHPVDSDATLLSTANTALSAIVSTTESDHPPVGLFIRDERISIERLGKDPATTSYSPEPEFRFIQRYHRTMRNGKVLEEDNNLGELRITGNVVEHRLLRHAGSSTTMTTMAKWDPAKWPIRESY